MGSFAKSRRTWWLSAIAMLAAAAASAQTGSPPTGQQEAKPQTPETAPAKPAGMVPGVVNLGPTREIKLADNTWFRFAVQVQAWLLARQDRLTTGADGSYGYDAFCRRCRFFATGSVVKNVTFNFLFEAAPGRADATTGVKAVATPQVLDAYGNIKFADGFALSFGSILLPLTRNGTQGTTTYLSLDVANTSTTPAAQGNTYVLRDLGVQADGYFVDNHLEYRIGIYQGSRQPATASMSAGHNGPRVVGSLMFNFWDPEVGYVHGGHYYGTKKVLGVMANVDYQSFRKDGPSLLPAPNQFINQDKNAYYGLSAAAFINLPLAGVSRTGGDEIAGLFQWGYWDGGLRQTGAAPSNPGTYPNVLKQMNYLAEGAYYNHAAKFSVFGKWEMRQIDGDYPTALKAASNVMWIAGGLKYYFAPANLANATLQYERTIFNDAPSGVQGGTNAITLALQTILY